MLKLAIIEDELFMREFLENCIDYAELSLEVCGSFCCAMDALDALKESKPDLIITDIKMPGMNGIEFMSEMLKINENTHFIVISNYLDFETVRNAFQIGICDYIPKIKFNLSSYRDILVDFVKNANLQEASKDSLYHSKEKLKKMFYDSSQAFGADAEDINEKMYSIALLEILNYDDIINSQWGMDKELLKYGISNYLEEILTERGMGDFFFDTYERIILLFSVRDYDTVMHILETIRDFLQKSFLIKACISWENFYAHLRALKGKLSEFEALKPLRFFLPESTIINKEVTGDFNNSFDYIKKFTEIDVLFQKKEFEVLSKKLYEITLIKPSLECADTLLFFYRNIFFLFAEFAKSEKIEFMNTEEIKEFMNVSTYENAYEYLILKLGQFSEYAGSDDNKLEQQIDEYIRVHYMEDITLKQVAQHFKYEYTYFSKVFRNIKGIAFKKHLNNIRLEEAEKLIRGTNLKYYTIALKVGYQNYEHFNRCFHEKYGCSPNEIKRIDVNE